ncbi:hypothetical protein FTO74_05655 [Granulicella sp. WH15]|uniref:hypothetical protein n=1 Tax=Granulicella sp. WH15 TaxID=2602070 RepID=UPI00136781A3|nr:hypothetical protein [Granulicella sp. WH15]QHN02912.1 hypothetical protein FTO74_05655 [Granulicella sp. WH15]
MAIVSAQTKDPHAQDRGQSLSLAQQQEVQQALEAVLASPSMRSTQQCQTLLQYIAEHTLSGELALLRERVIGTEVFGRKPDYEPGEDPIVRIRAADLRKRLALYYQSLPTVPDVRIDVPSGSYKATFTWKTLQPEPSEPFIDQMPAAIAGSSSPNLLSQPLPAHGDSVLNADPDSLAHKSFHLGMLQLVFLVALLIAGIFTVTSWYHGRSDRILRSFWAPVLDSPKPLLISIGSNAVYRVSDEEADAYSRQNHLESSGMEFFQQFAPNQTIASTGLHAAENSFVALGDVAAVSEAVSTLSHFAKTYQERFPNDISFAEVRNNPTLLIGGFNNPMTRELTRNFRFVLASRNRIEDRNQPGKAWVLQASDDSHDTEDYAIVTRVLHHGDDQPLVSVAGMGQYGTLAATDFVCSPEGIQQMGDALGGSWQKRNFQLVLRIKVMDFKPVSTSIIAHHTW